MRTQQWSSHPIAHKVYYIFIGQIKCVYALIALNFDRNIDSTAIDTAVKCQCVENPLNTYTTALILCEILRRHREY